MAHTSNGPQSPPSASTGQQLNSSLVYTSQGDGSNPVAGVGHPPCTSDLPLNLDEQPFGMEISSTALGRGKRRGRVPFYTGMIIFNYHHHARGCTITGHTLTPCIGEAPGFSSVLDSCSPSQQPVARHILISSEVSTSLSKQDRDYLNFKGVFTLPQKSTCDDLLRAYFHHIHPIMPIVDAKVLLKFHQTGKTSEWNLLLLWSIFFVAVNVHPPCCNIYASVSKFLLSLLMLLPGHSRATHLAKK